METVAVFGSRVYNDFEKVVEFVRELAQKHPNTTVISGGAQGVDTVAEKAALQVGLLVVSLRPTQIKDSFTIARWELGGEAPRVWTPDNPQWGTYSSAATYRDWLLSEEADLGVAFWNGYSRGTSTTMAFFRDHDKPLYTY